MIAGVEYTGEAALDLSHIWEYHVQRASARSADILIQRIEATLRNVLVRHPAVGRIRPEFGDGVWSFPVPPYVIFYRTERRHVHIIRVLHGHRDMQPPLISLLAVS